MKAKVYGSSQCVWCDRVAKLLEDTGIEIEKIDWGDAGNKESLYASEFSALQRSDIRKF